VLFDSVREVLPRVGIPAWSSLNIDRSPGWGFPVCAEPTQALAGNKDARIVPGGNSEEMQGRQPTEIPPQLSRTCPGGAPRKNGHWQLYL
jgi:hypothetical protein